MPVVLEADDLNDADEDVLDVLREGRGNPSYIAGRIGTDRSYINQRLKRLQEHGHVEKLATGLYELADDPRGETAGGDESELRARLQGALEARDDQQARADRLESELEDCQERLEDAREGSTDVDVERIRSGLSTASTALEGQNPDTDMAKSEIGGLLEAIENGE